MDFSTEFIVPEITKRTRRNRSMKTCRFSLFWYLRIAHKQQQQNFITNKYPAISYEHVNQQERARRVLLYERKCFIYFSSDVLQTEN